MDAYQIQLKIKDAWRDLVMQQNQSATLSKTWPAIPICIEVADKTVTVNNVVIKDDKIYLEIK
jgi:hypothetical protein